MKPDRIRKHLIKSLADLMSDISEQCWAAGWMDGTEFVLWNMLESSEREWGEGTVLESQIMELRDLSTELGGWIFWHEETSETFIPLAAWLDMFDSKWRPHAKTTD